MEAQTLLSLPVLLALEPVTGESPMPMTLGRDDAAELAQLVAADLLGLVPQVENARLVLAGALFDQVELLRPGFPVWAMLDELACRLPRGTLESVVAFGSHEGHMPAAELEPSANYADGPMRLLPVSLLAPANLAGDLSTQLEIQLVGRGEAGVKTADWLMRILGVRLEHVRYLSRNDLLALTCVQYEHVNLTPLWALLETALLTPERDESTMSARGLSLRYAGGTVLAQSPAQWLARQTGDPAQRALARASAPLHFVNFSSSACHYDAARDCAHGRCVVDAIERYAEVLGDRTRPDWQRAIALRFVVHFVADAHQPLHAGYRNDRGGNRYQVRWNDRGTNLHAIWDTPVLGSRHLGWRAYASALGRTPLPIARGTPAQWAEESCRMTRDDGIYPRGHRIDAAYLARVRPLAELRVREAAARLAALLDRELGNPRGP